jgi:class 3 adenylate cyclase
LASITRRRADREASAGGLFKDGETGHASRMATTPGATAARASVAFLKIQEFVRRPVMDQMRLRAQLEAVIAVATAGIDPSSRIVLDASDGAAIVVLADPGGVLRVAESALAARTAGLPLSVGVNHGAVQLADGGKDDEGMIGDGIAVAANIAEFASPSKLLASRAFRDALADAAPGEEACLVPAGVLTDPGLRSHELFGIDRGGARRRRVRFATLAAATAVAIFSVGVAVRISAEGQARFLESIQAKSGAYAAGLFARLKFWEVPPASPASPGGRGRTSRDKSRG